MKISTNLQTGLVESAFRQYPEDKNMSKQWHDEMRERRVKLTQPLGIFAKENKTHTVLMKDGTRIGRLVVRDVRKRDNTYKVGVLNVRKKATKKHV